MSADGRFVVFLSDSADLLPGQISTRSALLYDRVTGHSTLVPEPADGADISADGKIVAFSKGNTALRLYARDTGATALVSTEAVGTNDGNFPRPYALSADGRYPRLCTSSPSAVHRCRRSTTGSPGPPPR